MLPLLVQRSNIPAHNIGLLQQLETQEHVGIVNTQEPENTELPDAVAADNPSPRLLDTIQWAIVLICFFLSGAAGLIYEVCWIRIASLGFGSTTFALSTVLGVFFLGLAIGSHFAGKFAQKTERPLLYYAGLEIGLALFVILTPTLFGWMEGLFGVVYRATDSPTIHFLARFLLIAIVVLPPTIIMGATFPLFCRFLIRSNRRIAAGIAVVYSVNTLGAAAGCAITGFWLLRTIGLQLSLATGCCISAGCGLIVLLLPIAHRKLASDTTPGNDDHVDDQTESEAIQSESEKQAQQSDDRGNKPIRGSRLIPILFFLVGFCALGMEIIWARYLSLIVHNSVYTYTITLSVTLLGIVVGSLIVSLIPEGRTPRARIFGAIQVLLAILILGLLMTPPDIWLQIDAKFGNRILLYATLLFLPAVLSGASYPIAIRMAVHDVTDVARMSGTMAACNTLGGIIGSMFVGFIALPQLGIQNSLLLITGINLAIGVVTWVLIDRMHVYARYSVTVLAVVIWFAIPLITKVTLPQDYLKRHGEVIDFVEGYGSNISVVKHERKKILRIDGHWQGIDGKNHQIMAAHIPMQLLDEPKSVAVVGIGPGQTASRFLMYDIDQLTCVDIEPRLFGVVEEHFGGKWMKDSRTSIVREDGRNFLKHTDQKFDLISIELGQVFRPGVATFYTKDFYEEISPRLTDQGMVSQFLPISYFSVEDFRSVIHTFVSVFPEATLWYNHTELLLIGGKQGKTMLDRAKFGKDAMPEQVYADLEFSQWGGPKYYLNKFDMFAGGFLMGPEQLAQLSKEGETKILRDDVPELDYAVSERKIQGVRPVDFDISKLIYSNRSPVREIFTDSMLADPELQQHVDAIRLQRRLNIADIAITDIILRDITSNDLDQRIEGLSKLLTESPEHLRVNQQLGIALVARGDQSKRDFLFAERCLRIALAGDDSNIKANIGLAESLMLRGKFSEARPFFERAVELEPENFAALKGTANSLSQTREFEESLPYYQRAIEVAPDHADVRNDYGIALINLMRLKEANAQFRIAYELNPDHPHAKKNFEQSSREMQRQKGLSP